MLPELPAGPDRGSSRTAVCVVVVTYNSAQYVRKCLTSLTANAPRRGQHIVVVDNASSDDTAAIVRAEFPQVELVALDENVGFGRGNNAGFARCEAEYYYCHNADAYLQDNVLDRVIDAMEADRTIGIAGLPLVYPDHSPQTSAYSASTPAKWLLQGLGVGGLITKVLSLDGKGRIGKLLGKTKMGKSFVRTHARSEQQGERAATADVDWVCGASLLIRRATLADLAPGFDQDIFMYGEDEDLCLRARRKDWRVVQIDTVPVIHEFGWGKNVRASARIVQLKFEGLTTFIDKNFADKPASRIAMHALLRLKHLFWKAKAGRG